VHTSTAPASWSTVGRSLSTTAASKIEAAGWSSNSSDDSAAGSRGSDEVISSHPAVWLVNALLAETGAIPQIVAHDGRGPHIHVSRATAPMADRIAGHLAMGLAELLVAGESGRLRTCASPACREVFLEESRNRSRRYRDSRTCGNRLHVAAYRARKAAAG
jgi:hypothetical protein